MAVHDHHAPSPSSLLLPDCRNRMRMRYIPTQDAADPCVSSFLPQCHQYADIVPPLPPQAVSCTPPFSNNNSLQPATACSRKRSRQSAQLAPDFGLDNNFGATIAAPVSTGLRLAFQDDAFPSPTSTSGTTAPAFSLLHHDFTSSLYQQRQDTDLYLTLQGEQVRHTLQQKRQKFATALLEAVEQRVSRRLSDKDMELDKLRCRNLELEELVKQLSLEAHLWQNKVKTTESMLIALKSNYQQAVNLSRERDHYSREGCGDSEADDACSSHADGNVDAQAQAHAQAQARAFNKENRELREQRICRLCKSNEVSILLLPCRHLCLCKDCESRLDTCPICRALKNASVQVYMS